MTTADERIPGLGYELDNTPRWVWDDENGPGHGYGRCNPFGYETGSMSVLGGLRDPKHEKHIWYCRNHAEGRYQMTCVNGHRGTMVLCRAHVMMIRRRMAGLCPACAMPPQARSLEESMNRLMAEISCEPDPARRYQMGARLEDLRAQMSELVERGIVSTGAPLRLTEVS